MATTRKWSVKWFLLGLLTGAVLLDFIHGTSFISISLQPNGDASFIQPFISTELHEITDAGKTPGNKVFDHIEIYCKNGAPVTNHASIPSTIVRWLSSQLKPPKHLYLVAWRPFNLPFLALVTFRPLGIADLGVYTGCNHENMRATLMFKAQ